MHWFAARRREMDMKSGIFISSARIRLYSHITCTSALLSWLRLWRAQLLCSCAMPSSRASRSLVSFAFSVSIQIIIRLSDDDSNLSMRRRGRGRQSSDWLRRSGVRERRVVLGRVGFMLVPHNSPISCRFVGGKRAGYGEHRWPDGSRHMGVM